MTAVVEAPTALPIRQLKRGATVTAPSGINIRLQGTGNVVPVQRADGRIQLKIPQTGTEKNKAGQLQKLLAVVHSPQTWEAANEFHLQRPFGQRGRPAKQPGWLVLLFLCATHIAGTQRAGVALVSDPYVWEIIRRESDKVRPQHLPAATVSPPTRSQFRTMMKNLETEQGQIAFASACDLMTASSIAFAREDGYLDPEQPLRYNDLDFGQWVTYDGTTYDAATRAGKRSDQSAGDQLRSGKPGNYGSKVLFGSVRGMDFQSRWILDFQQVIGQTPSGVGDEAKYIDLSARRLKALAPGMRGVICDTILTSSLLAMLARSGILTVNFPVAAENPDRATAGRHNPRRKEKKAKLPTHTHVRPGGGECRHTLRVYGTVYQEERLNQHGKYEWSNLNVTGYKGGRPDADGNYRWYHEIVLPCQYGDQIVRVPLFHDPRIKIKGQNVNRGEHFRFYPQNTPQHQVMYGRRNDTESLHAQLKRTMWQMPAYTSKRQALFLLGVQLAQNSLTYAYGQRRAGLPNVIDGNT